MTTERVKAVAYALDPECWISYSGKPIAFKRIMEARRTASLSKAEEHVERYSPPSHLEIAAEAMRARAIERHSYHAKLGEIDLANWKDVARAALEAIGVDP